MKGPAVEGSGTVSSDHPGRVVVVNVWQSTCGPCRAEAAALEKASKQTAADATFVGLDVDDQQAAAQAFVRTSGTSYAHVYDPDSEQLLKFNGLVPLSAIPSTLVVDRQGLIAARIIGAVSADTLTQLVTDVAAGRWHPQTGSRRLRPLSEASRSDRDLDPPRGPRRRDARRRLPRRRG